MIVPDINSLFALSAAVYFCDVPFTATPGLLQKRDGRAWLKGDSEAYRAHCHVGHGPSTEQTAISEFPPADTIDRENHHFGPKTYTEWLQPMLKSDFGRSVPQLKKSKIHNKPRIPDEILPYTNLGWQLGNYSRKPEQRI